MKNLIIVSMLLFSPLILTAQNKNGLLLNGGNSIFRDVSFTETSWKQELFMKKFVADVGYRYRIQPLQSNYFYDLDLMVGIKRYNYGGKYGNGYTSNPYESSEIITSSTRQYFDFSFSFESSFNYLLTKNLSVGVGVAPTFYLVESSNPRLKFDIPLIAKTAYDFRFVEVGLYYKFGFTNSLNTRDFSSGKRSEWGISLFVPF